MVFLLIRKSLHDNKLRITPVLPETSQPGLRPSDSSFNFGSSDPIGPPNLRVFSRLRWGRGV